MENKEDLIIDGADKLINHTKDLFAYLRDPYDKSIDILVEAIMEKKMIENDDSLLKGHKLMCPFIYCFLIFGLEINDAIYPKKIAAAIPPALALTPPVNAPTRPSPFIASIAPLDKL